MPDFDADVVIVGAGPTGLMAAALLLRCGVKIRILEKSPSAAKESRAFGTQARTLELFLNMGLAEKFMGAGLIANGGQIFVNAKEAATINFGDIGRDDTPYPFILMVPQSETEKILAKDVSAFGAEVEYGAEVLSFEQAVEGVTVTARKDGAPFTLRCKYLIGADGAHSPVRQALGLRFDGAAYEQSFLLADCQLDWALDDDHFKIFLKGREFALYFPLKGAKTNRVIATQTENLQGAEDIANQGSTPATLEEVEESFNAATGMNVHLSNPTWLSRYRVHHRATNRYSRGRVFLGGDAAHIHSPVGAQGMNTGLQDVANLCWKLALVLKGAASNALLDTYHAERWPVGQKLLHFTDRAFSLVASKHGWVTALRNFFVPILAGVISRSRMARAYLFNFVSQLGIRYQGNSFLEDDHLEAAPAKWIHGLTPGRRAPNAPITRGSDVFDLLKGYQFHVLALSKTPLAEAPLASLATELSTLPPAVGLPLTCHIIALSLVGEDARLIEAQRQEVFKVYGLSESVPQALFLIRPDGHIAYRCDRLDVNSLKRFIKEKLTGIG